MVVVMLKIDQTGITSNLKLNYKKSQLSPELRYSQ